MKLNPAEGEEPRPGSNVFRDTPFRGKYDPWYELAANPEKDHLFPA